MLAPETASPTESPAWWLRAAGVAFVWGVCSLPVLLGRAVCPMAEVFGVPCPGCGMTRAIRLLQAGDIGASLHMHPLAVPSALASLAFMSATVLATASFGTPIAIYKTRWGRVAIASFAIVQMATLGVWVARMFGWLGGPVPV